MKRTSKWHNDKDHSKGVQSLYLANITTLFLGLEPVTLTYPQCYLSQQICSRVRFKSRYPEV